MRIFAFENVSSLADCENRSSANALPGINRYPFSKRYKQDAPCCREGDHQTGGASRNNRQDNAKSFGMPITQSGYLHRVETLSGSRFLQIQGVLMDIFARASRRTAVSPGAFTEILFYERLFENYCFVLLTNRAPPQISDNRPDMRQRAFFVTNRAAWRWNKMLLARENVDSPFAAMVVATEHNAI